MPLSDTECPMLPSLFLCILVGAPSRCPNTLPVPLGPGRFPPVSCPGSFSTPSSCPVPPKFPCQSSSARCPPSSARCPRTGNSVPPRNLWILPGAPRGPTCAPAVTPGPARRSAGPRTSSPGPVSCPMLSAPAAPRTLPNASPRAPRTLRGATPWCPLPVPPRCSPSSAASASAARLSAPMAAAGAGSGGGDGPGKAPPHHPLRPPTSQVVGVVCGGGRGLGAWFPRGRGVAPPRGGMSQPQGSAPAE